jgi:hypothetical protein
VNQGIPDTPARRLAVLPARSHVLPPATFPSY